MKKLLFIMLVFIFASCVTEKRCNQKYPPQITIKIKYIEKEIVKYKDTVIYKDLPPIIIERYVSVKDTLRLTGAYSEALSWVSGDKILGILKEGLKPVKIEYKIKEVEVVKIKTEYQEKIVNVKYIPKLVKILAYIGALSILVVGVWLFLKFK